MDARQQGSLGVGSVLPLHLVTFYRVKLRAEKALQHTQLQGNIISLTSLLLIDMPLTG